MRKLIVCSITVSLIIACGGKKTSDIEYKNAAMLDTAFAEDITHKPSADTVYFDAVHQNQVLTGSDTQEERKLITYSMQKSVGTVFAKDVLRKEKSANLGYSYPAIMSRNETRDINVFVSINNPESLVVSKLREIDFQQIPRVRNSKDTSVIRTQNIYRYKKLTIHLIDDGDNFIVDNRTGESQVIDSVNGNTWHWVIKTKSNNSLARLTLKLTGTAVDGKEEELPEEYIHIKIKLDSNWFRVILDYLHDNPKVSVPALIALAGFIGFIIRYLLGRKKGVDDE
ncbi:MAG TPA: hypothetical protein VFN30_14130 [Chitinophagaceae bacterium]|nr:hypothetical protein [Chitinophagaceae bacterium]